MRRKKCDESKSICHNCQRLRFLCVWNAYRPSSRSAISLDEMLPEIGVTSSTATATDYNGTVTINLLFFKEGGFLSR